MHVGNEAYILPLPTRVLHSPHHVLDRPYPFPFESDLPLHGPPHLLRIPAQMVRELSIDFIDGSPLSPTTTRPG